jgi:hypothetical protein
VKFYILSSIHNAKLVHFAGRQILHIAEFRLTISKPPFPEGQAGTAKKTSETLNFYFFFPFTKSSFLHYASFLLTPFVLQTSHSIFHGTEGSVTQTM